MGQHCSCLEQTLKHRRRQSDDVETVDMERGDEEDDDDEYDVDGNEDQELLRSRTKTDSSGGCIQRGDLKRSGSTRTIGLVLDGDEEEKGAEELHGRRADCDVERARWDTNCHVMPFSQPGELRRLLHSYQEATGVIDEGQLELECIICLDTFSLDDPKVRTLCTCGMNRTNFHMSCLFEWLNRDANCPVCREYLYFEDS